MLSTTLQFCIISTVLPFLLSQFNLKGSCYCHCECKKCQTWAKKCYIFVLSVNFEVNNNIGFVWRTHTNIKFKKNLLDFSSGNIHSTFSSLVHLGWCTNFHDLIACWCQQHPLEIDSHLGKRSSCQCTYHRYLNTHCLCMAAPFFSNKDSSPCQIEDQKRCSTFFWKGN